MNSPESRPPGVAYKLRLTVRDEVADGLLARLSDEKTRQTLPGFLFVFSGRTYTHQPDDYVDGFSHKELLFKSYIRKINDFNRHTFASTELIELHDRFLHFQATLGHEVANRVISPPLFRSNDEANLDMYYTVPGSEKIDTGVVDDLQAYLHERALEHRQPDMFDELALVTSVNAFRQINIRSRERRNDILYP